MIHLRCITVNTLTHYCHTALLKTIVVRDITLGVNRLAQPITATLMPKTLPSSATRLNIAQRATSCNLNRWKTPTTPLRFALCNLLSFNYSTSFPKLRLTPFLVLATMNCRRETAVETFLPKTPSYAFNSFHLLTLSDLVCCRLCPTVLLHQLIWNNNETI